MFSSNITLQRGHWPTFPAENTIAYPIILLHFGHLIPIYNSMFPTPNNANALYNIGLKRLCGIYFSVNANTNIAANPIATKVKHKFFCLFILSIDFMVSLYADLTLRLSCGASRSRTGEPSAPACGKDAMISIYY